MVGSALTDLTNSLVTDIMTPLVIGVWAGHALEQKFVVIRSGKAGPHYDTIDAGEKDGAVLWKYGRFIDKTLSFVLTTLVVFLMWKAVDRVRKAVEKRIAKDQEKKDEAAGAQPATPQTELK
eukprot:c6879_g1_i2.p2 GENE.c6879_g1_i2~~c6879_g1_i2.p2  ORF type:complete len:122 (-),score=32.00 c6879_g1_i2:71-436(-)